MTADQFFKSNFSVTGEEKMRVAAERLRGQPTQMPNGIRSNTTVFTIVYDGGVIIAGDRRTADGYLGIASDISTKVVQLSSFSALASAGYCNVISYLEDNMAAACRNFSEAYGRQLSPDGQAEYLKKLLESWWFFFVSTWYWTIGVPILATYDIKFNKPRIFTFDYDGYFYEPPFFAGTGCGFDSVKGLIINEWRKDIKEEQIIKLAVRAMLLSGATSSGVSDARLVLPTLAVIDKAGFRWVPKEAVANNRDQLVQEIGGLQCLLA